MISSESRPVSDQLPATRLPRALRPFATSQYRILALALLLSLFGSGVWLVAVVWQVIALGGSPIDLSIVATGSAVGMILAVLFGGVLADRIPQKWILLAIEGVKVVMIAGIAALAFAGVLEVWHLAVAAFVLRYMFRTPWLLGTLIYACLFVLVVIGPIEVLLPFAVKDQTGGGAESFAIVLAAFGIGGAVGSIVVASLRLPRRYLTVMNVLWGIGCVPLVLVGFTDQLWVMALACFITGFGFSSATVIWGTLLQRRVPPELLGRVSSLDFFVSLALMPISMALAGPVGVAIGIPITFIVAGAVPILLAVVTILAFRMPADEIANPIDGPDAQIDPSSQEILGPGAPIQG